MPADLSALHALVVGCAFALAFVFGFVGHSTNFCTMGAIADIVNFGAWDRMRMWVLAIAVAMIGTAALVGAGLIDTTKTIYATPRLAWLSSLVGGALFGFGMVLGSGCGSKTLIRIGHGNLKSLVVALAIAISAAMTLRGLFAVWRVNTVDTVAIQLATNQDLGSVVAHAGGFVRPHAQAWMGALLGLALAAWVFAPRAFRESAIKRDIVLGGLVVGAVIVAAWWVSGSLGYIAEDPNTLEERFIATNSGRMESFSFVAPFAYALELLMLWSDASRIVSFGIATVAGVIAGSLAHALLSKRFRWEGFRDAEDTANHLTGGVLMGAGGVTALGCTIGQGISGVSTLALGSFLALAGIVAGAIAALRYQAWRIERLA